MRGRVSAVLFCSQFRVCMQVHLDKAQDQSCRNFLAVESCSGHLGECRRSSGGDPKELYRSISAHGHESLSSPM
ncbi:uncharacterized protein EV422DRAFT_519463 [Fimicolochytrium jonesii]|uniref:uncharacterized protein n=1 Tax=Fimicolochytrium jonesii TaxID=1396493 RepID=UPI0022FE6F59|nr:uncharacterized protein EV422DRAFT_519463 [Fimicolochytrium jonesii]KAI8824252.1 hypothetical protein EV422DRAFT_519463 [Fimicolochytrium jonesii]